MRKYSSLSRTSVVLRRLRFMAGGALLLAAVAITCAPQMDGADLIAGRFGLRFATERGRLKTAFVVAKIEDIQRFELMLPAGPNPNGAYLRVIATQFRTTTGWADYNRRRSWEDLWFDTFSMTFSSCVIRIVWIPGWIFAVPGMVLLLYSRFISRRHALGGFEVHVQAKPEVL